MMIKNILVTASNGDLAEAVTGVLLESFDGLNIYGCEASSPWPGLLMHKKVFKVPRGDDEKYINEIKKIVVDFDIDLIVPCSDNELLNISRMKSELNCHLLMPNIDLIEIFLDKYSCAKWLEKFNLNPPKTKLLLSSSAKDLPLVVKPRHGSGSYGVFKVKTEELLEGLKKEYGNSYIAQEYLDNNDQEFTCALYNYKSITRILILHRRLDAGRTVEAKIVKNAAIEELLSNLIGISKLEGLINVQLRLTDQGPKIFEINPRVSSTVKMRHMLGFKDLVWSIMQLNRQKIPEYTTNIRGTAFRLSREIIKTTNEFS